MLVLIIKVLIKNVFLIRQSKSLKEVGFHQKNTKLPTYLYPNLLSILPANQVFNQ
ncbi:hypothetical protein M23134_05214 [Microscilla marina ATCC 23134]|uniref:Uncharacterized protein n=1 Tax=Microscilla marina ATCC 23134 TaxID=313606 RepID=A1ZDG8_MICM2|nr:hypothetical protein M23134_05214 [Microscilla marina ATCC 23134]